MITDSVVVAIGGMAMMMALLFLLITRYQWHVFAALLVPILLFALAPGVDRRALVAAFEQGFGRTIQSIAIVIVLGSLLAEALKHTGAIERITESMIWLVGRRRLPLALTLSGFVVGIPIFSDIAYVVLNPLVHSAAASTGATMATMATGMVGAIQLTHVMVPPTPGPLAAVALVNADLGRVIVLGSFTALVASFAGWLFALVVGRRLGAVPPPAPAAATAPSGAAASGAFRHATWRAYAPVVVPLVLIAGQSAAGSALPGTHVVNAVMVFLGWPVVALTIGVLLAYANTTRADADARRNAWIESALRTSAMIIVVTGLGGSLSQILRQTPAVDAVAQAIADAGVQTVFLPFVLGVIGNMITGSSTVAVITAASVTGPMMPALGLSPEAVVLAGAAGSMIVKYVNSSYFWVCTSLSGLPLREALVAYGGVTLVNGLAAMLVVYALWIAGMV